MNNKLFNAFMIIAVAIGFVVCVGCGKAEPQKFGPERVKEIIVEKI